MNDGIVYGWHFLAADGTARGGYRPPAVGVWEPPIGYPQPCVRGYHGSPTILKALAYASGPILGRCEYRGVVWGTDGTKWAARERRCVARVDASAWLRFAACHFAEEALLAGGVTDERSHNAIAVARRFALGLATAEELVAARASADAAFAAYAAYAAFAAYAASSASSVYAATYTRDASASADAYDARESWLESAALDLDTAPEWRDAARGGGA